MVNLCKGKLSPVCLLIFAICLWEVALPAFAIDAKNNMGKEDKYIKIISPTKNDVYEEGQSCYIRWEAKGIKKYPFR